MVSPWSTALLVLGAQSIWSTLAAARAEVLETRQTLSPVSVTPSEDWDGIDGSWSSFNIHVGTPSQYVRVFASWMAYQTWVVHPQGCTQGDSQCVDRRGGIFNINKSSSWDEVGLYSLAIQQNLGNGGNAYFGYDVVGLGGNGQEGLSLKNSTVGDLAVTDYYLGLLGLNPKPTNWTSFSNGAPSFITQLKQQGKIPSVSFGYTAGAPYRFTRVQASLTLGGYDTSRFESNDVEFTLAADNSRDTVVGIQSITTTKKDAPSETVQLLPSPIFALVDATAPQIWLPVEACQAFEDEFGLVYDNTTDLYLVNTSLHGSLLARDAKVSFKIGEGTSGDPSVTIDFPYAAFDLTARPPYRGLENETTYFPLRRAANDTQYTLGRAFMQEAYISVDYERAKFNLSKVIWQQDAPASLVAISPAPITDSRTSTSSGSGSQSKSGFGIGAIVGVVVGAVVVIAIIVGVLIWRHKRKQKALKKAAAISRADSTTSRSDAQSSSGDTIVVDAHPYFSKAELDGDPNGKGKGQMKHMASTTTRPTNSPISPASPDGTLSTTGTLVSPVSNASPTTWAGEKDGTQVFEMPGSFPDLILADSKQITEKDMMRHRERQYNGIDTVEEQRERERQEETDIIVSEPRPRRTMVDANDVREATEEEGGNRRFSFIQGQDRIS